MKHLLMGASLSITLVFSTTVFSAPTRRNSDNLLACPGCGGNNFSGCPCTAQRTPTGDGASSEAEAMFALGIVTFDVLAWFARKMIPSPKERQLRRERSAQKTAEALARSKITEAREKSEKERQNKVKEWEKARKEMIQAEEARENAANAQAAQSTREYEAKQAAARAAAREAAQMNLRAMQSFTDHAVRARDVREGVREVLGLIRDFRAMSPSEFALDRAKDAAGKYVTNAVEESAKAARDDFINRTLVPAGAPEALKKIIGDAYKSTSSFVENQVRSSGWINTIVNVMQFGKDTSTIIQRLQPLIENSFKHGTVSPQENKEAVQSRR